MKAEEYIAHNTRNGDNMIYYHNHNFTHGTDYVEGSGIEVTYIPWVTPENALVVVAIAKKELMDKACEWMSSHLQMQYDGFSDFIKDFRKAIEETNNEIK